MGLPYPNVGVATSHISESNMDELGITNYETLVTDINSKTTDLGEMKEMLIKKGDLVLDETGKLAEKTKEGLKEISETIAGLEKIKKDLLSTVETEGKKLRTNWEMDQNRIAKEAEAAAAAAAAEAAAAKSAGTGSQTQSSTDSETPNLPSSPSGALPTSGRATGRPRREVSATQMG